MNIECRMLMMQNFLNRYLQGGFISHVYSSFFVNKDSKGQELIFGTFMVGTIPGDSKQNFTS